MKSNKYLIIYKDKGYFPFFTEADDFKKAVKNLAEYTGTNDKLFFKAIDAMETEEEVVRLYERFSSFSIEIVYSVNCILFKTKKEG